MTKRYLTVALLCAASLATAQTTVNPVLVPHVAFLDGNGFPCNGCKLYSYSAGTTTPLVTYKDSALTPNTNPVVLDAAGGAFVWTTAVPYKFALKDALGNPVWTVDNVAINNMGSWNGHATLDAFAATTVNGHALTGSFSIAASDIVTGTLPHPQLPVLLSGDIPGGSVTYNTSAVASAADNGLIVKMDCAAPCTYTLPATQISTTWFTPLVISTGAGAATVVLGGGATFNASATPPVLPAIIRANTNVATGYMGNQIYVPVPDVQFTVASFAIPATTCYGSTGSTTPATFSMPKLTTAMKVTAGFTGNASAITGWGTAGGLNIMVWASAANTASYLVCNATSGSITGGAITFIAGAQ